MRSLRALPALLLAAQALLLGGTASASSPPAAPWGLEARVAPGGTPAILLAWSPPDSDGGSPITGYSIYRGTGPGVETLVATTEPSTSFADTSIAPGTPYRYRVSATNAHGEGPLSAEAYTAGAPTFANYTPPKGLGSAAGEPSIGVNWETGAVMYQAELETLRVTFGDSATPATAAWTDVSPLLTSVTTLDPILFTDPRTGRTFVSQLYLACSLMAYTDDDGSTWTQNPLGCGPGAVLDHQTVGGGPFAPPLTNPLYPHGVYYCAQAIADASCSFSVDGGLTFGPGVPIYTLLTCGGLHGQVKVAPNDGTAYVPNANCGGAQGFAVSTNNGLTWTVRTVPGSSTQNESDPAVGIGADGTVYFGYADGDGHPKIAVSTDRGMTWSTPVDVGAPFGVQNAQFPAVVAGDSDRAAFAFLGTPTAGDDQSLGFTGEWHLFVALTYDRGETWTTVDATPDDPVQRGCIWMFGGSHPCRNLLDFMGITVDEQGRVLVGYADGCIGSCVTGGNTRSKLASIARLSGGEGLFADPNAPR